MDKLLDWGHDDILLDIEINWAKGAVLIAINRCKAKDRANLIW